MGKFVLLVLVIIAVAIIFTWLADKEYDDTDPPGDRSGLGLYIDHRTGCHYLGLPRGGITPRRDRDGNHICEPEKKVL